jgi:hypothetical protein
MGPAGPPGPMAARNLDYYVDVDDFVIHHLCL